MPSCMEARIPSEVPTYQARLAYWGALVRAARTQRGWSQDYLAAQITALVGQQQERVSRSTINDFERGSPGRTNLTLTKFMALCDVLGIDDSVLLLDPTSPRAQLMVTLQGKDPAIVADLNTLLAKLHGPAFRDRRRRISR